MKRPNENNSRLYFDARWNGNHGIARYSRGIYSSIPINAKYLYRKYPPFSLLSLLLSFRTFRRNSVFYSPGFLAMPFARVQLITIHDLIQLKYGSFVKRKLFGVYYRSFLGRRIRKGNIYIATVSKESRNEISTLLQIDSEHIHLLPPGLDKEFIIKDINSLNTVNENRIMCVTSNKEHKNFDYFLEIVKNLKGNWQIDVVGISEYSESITLNENFVNFHIDVNETRLLELYKACRIIVVPSKAEGFCLPALEGAALGKAIVHFENLSTISRIAGSLAFKVTAKASPAEFARVIESIDFISKSAIKQEILRIQSEYSWERTSRELASVLTSILNAQANKEIK